MFSYITRLRLQPFLCLVPLASFCYPTSWSCASKYLAWIKNHYNIMQCVFSSAFPTPRPVTFDPSRHLFNADRSHLTIRSVARADGGVYICKGTNKIDEDSATITLHVFGWFSSVPLWLVTLSCCTLVTLVNVNISIHFNVMIIDMFHFRGPRGVCVSRAVECVFGWACVCVL